MIKGIIFDLDGVLLSTDKYHYRAWKMMADQEGIYFDEEINNRLRGVSRMESLEIILERSEKEYSLEEKQALCESKNNNYRESLKELKKEDVSDDIRETLKTLREKGYKLAIGSSSRNTRFILEQVELTDYFDAISDGNNISKSKPDPEVFLKAADMLGLPVKECLVIEDAFSGIDAACAGGFESIGIGDASKYEKCNYKIKDLKEVVDIVENCKSPKMVISHLRKVYPNGVEAIHDFSLDIEDEEFVVFVGPSGCGKSTVLRMIAGLEEVTDGSITLDGQDITDAQEKDRNIAMVFQNYALYPHLTVRKNIAFPLNVELDKFKNWFRFKYRKQRKAEINQIVEDAAAKIGLTEYLDRLPANLSGGQRQRVALGRAIVRNPKVFLLDEPLSNLDAKMRVQMRSEISRLHDQLKTIFVYVTHDQVEAMTMGTKIVVLKDGYIQQVGRPSDIFINPVNIFVAGFIGTPQMNFFDIKLVKEKGDYYAVFEKEENIKIKLPKERLVNLNEKYVGETLTLGVRPKAVSVKGDLSYVEQNIKAKISLFEQLGEETIIYASSAFKDDDLIISTTGLDRFNKEEEIGVSFDMSFVCLFDEETGNSVL